MHDSNEGFLVQHSSLSIIGFTTSRRMRLLVGGEEYEGSGKKGGVKAHLKIHPAYQISAEERSHCSSGQIEFFKGLQMSSPVGGIIHC